MRYEKDIVLKNGRPCRLRQAAPADTRAVLDCFAQAHRETDNLLSYPDELTRDVDEEESFLARQQESAGGVELCAELDGHLVGLAGLSPVGERDKLRHRAGFGISILRDWWGLGLGRALTQAALDCAEQAGYLQVELSVISDNAPAIALYRELGFVEYGRNPRGFRTRDGQWQELILMRREL